jgi:hypothetical protein
LILCSIVSVVFAAAQGGLSVAVLISKSKYMAGVQCLKRLYLLVHSPELGTGKSESDFALMEQGREVGKLARQLFPGGVEAHRNVRHTQ